MANLAMLNQRPVKLAIVHAINAQEIKFLNVLHAKMAIY
jgi:hypothetical protein